MSLRNLFDKKVVSAKSLSDLASDAESADNVVADRKRAEEFIPPIDFSSASNFSVYGSAEKYYSDAITRIYQEFPYDGSEKEMNQFHLTSSYLDKYILEERYPRTNGYVLLSAEGWGTKVSNDSFYGAPATASYEYIFFKGGPNTTLTATDNLTTAFTATPERDQNNVLDISKRRGNNLALDAASGSTVEFWMKKEEFMGTLTSRNEVILDIWNNTATGSNSYGRLRVELDDGSPLAPFKVTYRSGSSGLINAYLGGTNSTKAKILEGNWGHYAITILSSSNALTAELYANGVLEDTTSSVGSVNEITGTLTAYVGALQTAAINPTNSGVTVGAKGWGKLTASLDEFRYWKTARTGEEVGRNYWTQVRGGTNTDDANTDLGVYFKFNEGITGDADTDSTVLDYSGRISNGAWTGYSTSSRNTGSAMVLAGAADFEFKDPIIYSDHPEVSSLETQLKTSGSVYDYENNSSIFHSLPAWIVESDDSGDLKNLTQIIASYFDKLQNQIKYVPELKNITYLSSSDKPYPFASNLVESAGLIAPEIFVDATILESIMDRDEDRQYVLELDDVKNQIYQNIYNNLVYIYKSKGTEKAFRNLIHCYGVDDQLIRLNTYGNNVVYELRDNFRSVALAKNVVDFDQNNNHEGSVYQYTDPLNSNSVSFISGTAGGVDLGGEDYTGFTLESEIVFPKRVLPEDSFEYVEPGFITVSLFGMHSADPADSTDTSWASGDYADIRIQAIRPETNSKDAKFKILSSVSAIPTITTDLFKDVYDNSKWNFAVRLINEKYPLGDVVEGVTTSGSTYVATPYKIEFYGINTDVDITRNEFYLTGTVANSNAINALRSAKRVFAGAHRTNFTGAILQKSDIKLSNVRYWADYIPNETIKAHSRDTENYGTLHPNRSAFLLQSSLTGSYIPEAKTLALNWNFYNITGSNTSGQFTVSDYSSGSTDLQTRYGWLGNIVDAQHTGLGNFFSASSDAVIRKQYLNNAKQNVPEVIQTSEMINIMSDDSKFFARNQRPIDYYLSIEKSMYQTISDEMINLFATIVEFNTLIGDPINRYRQDYKGLEKARQLFFENVENTPDLDKFIEFYKWIDSSLSIFLQQLIPASAKSSNEVRTLIESHVLERNKYWSKFPTLDSAQPSNLEGTALGSGVGEGSPVHSIGLRNVVISSRPISGLQRDHASYWRIRAPRDSGILASGDAGVDSSREAIRLSLLSGFLQNKKRPVHSHFSKQLRLHGGINYPSNKKRSLVYNATYPHGPVATSGTPLNALMVDNLDVESFRDIDDVIDPNEKKYYPFKTTFRRTAENGVKGDGTTSYEGAMAGTIAAPFNLLSSSAVTSGYNKTVISDFKSGSQIVNLHSDTTTLDNDIPMQGPFTRVHVGGHQSRHVSVNRYEVARSTLNNLDDYTTRPEAWQLLLGNTYTADNTFLGLVGPDYPYPVGPYPYTIRKWAVRYREELAKRPLNIRNIKFTTSSVNLGNYTQNYQVLQTGGRSINNRYFIKNNGVSLPSSPIDLDSTLPQTNTLSTLIGLSHPNIAGNIFGPKAAADGALDVSGRYDILASASVAVRTGSASKSISVNRFSAPGGPEVNSLGYLDIIAAEKSVYNALPFRNLSVRSSGSGEDGTIRIQDQLNRRRGLQTLLSLHAGQFGHDPNYGSVTSTEYVTSPAYQKTNRNTRSRLAFGATRGYSGAITTGSVYDNAYVTHPIPRSDLQYSWITASYSATRIYGHAWNDSVVSSSQEGFQQAIDFTDISQITAGGLNVDFVNLNTLIYDPLNTSTNIVSASNGDYRNTAFATLAIPEMLNGLLLHRNGPYGVSSWKQIRGDKSPIARSLRKRNLISFYESSDYTYPLNVSSSAVLPKRGAMSRFVEAPISNKYKPVLQRVVVRRLTSDGREIERPVNISSTYGNNLAFFNNSQLNNSYDTKQNTPELYDRIANLYLEDQTGNPDSPVQEFELLKYKERVYPAATNAFSSSIRIRQHYQNQFWRNSRNDRTQTGVNDLLDLSNATISESMWPLDADSDFLTRQVATLVTSAGAAGVLQNEYSQLHLGDINSVTASALYARRHTVDTIGSVTSPVGGVIIPSIEASSKVGDLRFNSFSNWVTGGNKPIGVDQYYAGQALWEAASQSGKQPWYNSYNDYASHMRLIGKDYSVVPSFRISEHINRYTGELNGNFFADNLSFLEITGGATSENVSNEDNFYKTYTNSDFLKFFEVIRDQHSDVATPQRIMLECKALKKFIPYDGFYPADRMVQLTKQFSASYGPHVKFTGPDSGNPNAAMRSFVTPFYAPGIAFNTIKSGLAVDYPMFSASVDTHRQIFKGSPGAYYAGAVISGSNDSGQFHYRIPFEALLEPERYISDTDMVDLEPHPSCSLNVTASWGGRGDDLYKMMANNFFAEIPEFFLPQKQFASLVSKPESRFMEVQQGEQFAARIKVYKSLNVPFFRTGSAKNQRAYRNPIIPRDGTNIHETFTMYSRPSAFGPPCGGGEGSSTVPRLEQTSYDGYNLPFTPPYYNGECWADLIFTAPRTSTSVEPITLEDIFNPNNLAASYLRVGNGWTTEAAANTIYNSGNIEANSMQMDASFNLFGKAQIKNLRYDPSTGKPIEALDSTENVWVIQPKMETPMLNFSGAAVTLPEYGSGSVAYGMWHQYGRLPDDPNKGIFMQITDIPENYINYALAGDPATTGSLVDLVGFKTQPVRLGQVAPYKSVKEAVVAVPFVYTDGERQLFKLSKDLVRKADQLVTFGDTADIGEGERPGNSVIQMVRAMKDYIFPPRMDFLKNSEAVDPFSMYIFEFEHTFSQQDLADMWQNLAPNIGYAFDIEKSSYPPSSEVAATSVIEHDILVSELLSGDLDSKIQWMVFKVKQQANKNYFSKVIADEINQISRFDSNVGVEVGRDDSGKAFQPEYSYNWPYDFFSLVELVKLDAEVTLGALDDD